MNWKHWLDRGDIQKVHVTLKSLGDLASLVDRDLNDAQVTSLSADRRFAIAYNAALNLASYVVRKNGYRIAAKVGHHRRPFVGSILVNPPRDTPRIPAVLCLHSVDDRAHASRKR